MKIKDYKSNENLNPQIIVSVSGTLMYFNDDARKTFHLKIKTDISHLIDIDELKKFSMYNNKIEIFETLHPEYKYAIISITGDGINKILKISFKKSIGKTEEKLKIEKNILFVANNITINKNVSFISLEELSKDIKNIVVSKGYFLNTYVKVSEIVKVNQSQIQALILCAIAMMNETSPNRPVDLYIRRDMNNLIEAKVTVRVDTTEEKHTEYGIEEVFPWCAIRIALINKICEDNDIKYNTVLTEKSLQVIYKFKEEQIQNINVNSFDIGRLTLEEIYELLAPRENLF